MSHEYRNVISEWFGELSQHQSLIEAKIRILGALEPFLLGDDRKLPSTHRGLWDNNAQTIRFIKQQVDPLRIPLTYDRTLEGGKADSGSRVLLFRIVDNGSPTSDIDWLIVYLGSHIDPRLRHVKFYILKNESAYDRPATLEDLLPYSDLALSQLDY